MQNTEDHSLPVFVFPTQLTFYANDSNSHRQLVTIYNPYDFIVSFQVLCTVPTNYSVMDPQGIIKPRCCVDIALRRLNIPLVGLSAAVISADKFRVFLRRRDKPTVSGWRDLRADLYSTAHGGGDPLTAAPDDDSNAGVPSSLPAMSSLAAMASSGGSATWRRAQRQGADATAVTSTAVQQYPMPAGAFGGAGTSAGHVRSGWLLVFMAGLCVACLSAPDPDSEFSKILQIPDWLAFTTTQKLVAAYVLGLVTCALLLQR